jgi:hypothetical protein
MNKVSGSISPTCSGNQNELNRERVKSFIVINLLGAKASPGRRAPGIASTGCCKNLQFRWVLMGIIREFSPTGLRITISSSFVSEFIVWNSACSYHTQSKLGISMNYTEQPSLPSADKRWKIVDATARRYGREPHALIETLHTVQESFGYLDETALRYVAGSLKLPLSRVYGVATFYHFFTLKPKGKHTCVVCTGTACYIKGAP